MRRFGGFAVLGFPWRRWGDSGWVGRRVVVGVHETVHVREGERVVAEDPG
jgi:hypothetical protein